MGNQISVQASENIQEQMSETINNIVNNVNNELSSNSNSKQVIRVNIGDGATVGGKINIKQNTEVQMTAIINNFSETVAEISSDIMSGFSVDNVIENEMKQSGIILGQNQVSMQAQSIKQKFKDTIEQNVESSIKNVINLDQSSENTIEINIGNNFTLLDSGEIIVDQSTIIKAISDNISESIVSSILDSSIINTAEASTDMSSAMTQEGISEWAVLIGMLLPIFLVGALGSLMSSIGNGIKLILILFIPISLIVIGVSTLLQYNKAIYYVCVNDPNSEYYIEKDLDKNENAYINPDFLYIPEKNCNGQNEEECVEFPEGFGDPETAYLLPEKQKEYNLLENQLSASGANIDSINKNMEKLATNKSNWTCANGSEPINDPSKSDSYIMGYFSSGSWNKSISIILIILGIFSFLVLLWYFYPSGNNQNTQGADLQGADPQNVTQNTQGGKRKKYKKMR